VQAAVRRCGEHRRCDADGDTDPDEQRHYGIAARIAGRRARASASTIGTRVGRAVTDAHTAHRTAC
jgi:hypothetical protein